MYYGEEEQKVGTDSLTDINAELEHFNWGAFFLGWIWAIFNGAWGDIWVIFILQVLFSILANFLGPIFLLLFLALEIYIGIKGNEWAYYGTKKWKNLEHFRKTQRNWVGISIVASIILNFGLYIVLAAVGISTILKPENRQKLEKIAQERKSQSQSQNSTSSSEYPELYGLKGMNYSFSTLKPETLEYLKTNSEYKDYFDGKKLVIYFTGANCPYAQVFETALSTVKNNSTYSSEFNFYAQNASGMKTFSSQADAQADIDFSNSCHEFCIVNTKNGQMFAIDGVGEEEAAQVGFVIIQLKDW